MNEFQSIVDSIYGKFLLRDLFTKMVPGAVVALAFLHTLPIYADDMEYLDQVGWPLILLAAGITWILGFAIQQIGETTGLIKHHPKDFGDDEIQDKRGYSRYEFRNRFDNLVQQSPKASQQAERFAVVKEACGNFATAILFASILLGTELLASHSLSLASISVAADTLVQFVMIFIIFLALLKTNRGHAKKHYKFMESFVGKPEETSND